MASHAAPDSARGLSRSELRVDGALAVAVFVVSVALLVTGTDLTHHHGDADGLTLLLTALATLPLAARRPAPLPVFVVTALASSTVYAIAHPVGPPLGPTLALYFLAASPDELRGNTRVTLPIVAVLLLAHVSASGIGSDRFPGAELLFGVLVWGGAWLAGDRTRLRQERMGELEERARRAEEDAERERRLAAAEERSRIARDLHDSAGHAINVILVHAGLGRIRGEADAESAREAFETIEQVARETVAEIDQLVGALREDGARGDRVDVEPPAGLAALGSLVERHRAAGMDVTVEIRGDRRPLSSAVDRAAYRILQEALTNAARHGAGRVHVDLGCEATTLDLEVVNTLRAERSATDQGSGHGIIGMRERAELIGGSLEAGVSDGEFRVRAQLPVHPQP